MADITGARRALVARILDGEGQAPPAERRAAFDNRGLTGAVAALVDKVVRHAHRVTDDDVAAVRASGLTEDRIYELVVCAAVGEGTRQLEAAQAALAAAAERR